MTFKVIRNVTARQSAYDFLLSFHSNYGRLWYRFPDIKLCHHVRASNALQTVAHALSAHVAVKYSCERIKRTGKNHAYNACRGLLVVLSTDQLFAEQVLGVVSKHDSAVRHDASFQLLATHNEPSIDKLIYCKSTQHITLRLYSH